MIGKVGKADLADVIPSKTLLNALGKLLMGNP
jgi:hypothetical protein